MEHQVTQCKDIPERPILEFLKRMDGRWANWFGLQPDGTYFDNSVVPHFPSNTPDKLVLAKMKQLMRRGLVGGCDCGCRGDFVLTRKGEEWLESCGTTSSPD